MRAGRVQPSGTNFNPMTFGQNYVEYVQEWMRLNKSPKVSWRILSELADEFMQKREASMKAQKKAKVQRKTTGIAGQIPPPEDVARAHYREKGYTFDFFKWWGHYETCGWVVGRARMKNWCAAMVKWQGSDPKRPPSGGAAAAPIPAGIPEPGEGWRERVKDHEDLGRWSEAVWEQIMPYYQRSILRFLKQAA